mmetsp:Transcript_13942/g.32433  ORF Transcript_13942/g.32433 Transcript_13942/m.32433 type:complete len:241 (+) Transcript_13942:1254-1976(+)
MQSPVLVLTSPPWQGFAASHLPVCSLRTEPAAHSLRTHLEPSLRSSCTAHSQLPDALLRVPPTQGLSSHEFLTSTCHLWQTTGLHSPSAWLRRWPSAHFLSTHALLDSSWWTLAQWHLPVFLLSTVSGTVHLMSSQAPARALYSWYTSQSMHLPSFSYWPSLHTTFSVLLMVVVVLEEEVVVVRTQVSPSISKPSVHRMHDCSSWLSCQPSSQQPEEQPWNGLDACVAGEPQFLSLLVGM